MATWIATAVTFIPDAVKLAMHFTRGKPKDNATETFAKQIAELQEAATQSADWAKELTDVLRREVAELRGELSEASSKNSELSRELRSTRTICIVSATIAAISLVVAIYALAN